MANGNTADGSNNAADEPEHEQKEKNTNFSVIKNQNGDVNIEDCDRQNQIGEGYIKDSDQPFAKMTFETFDKMHTKKLKRDKHKHSIKRRKTGWLTFDL